MPNPFLKILYRFHRASFAVRHGTRRRFTPAELMILIGCIAALTTGLDTENTVAYQAITPLLCLLLCAVAFTWSFRARFAATRLLPRLGTVGQPLIYRVLLKNLGPKPHPELTLLETIGDPRPTFEQWKAAQDSDNRTFASFRFSRHQPANQVRRGIVKEARVPSARPSEEVEASVQLTPLRRGVIRFSNITLARPDPLGLFRAFVHIPSSQSILVLPKRYRLPPVPLPGTMKYQEGGVALASNIGQSDEFFSLRDYRRGDPFRHIHWRSWAKVGKPIVREYEDEFFVRHALVLDTFTDELDSDRFEEAVSLAASFACTIPNQESLLDLLFIGPTALCFTAGRGLAHTDQMLEVLAAVEPCRDKPFHSLEHLVINHVTSVSGCICVFLAWDNARHTFINKLKSLGVPLLVFVIRDPGKPQTIDPGPMQDQPGQFHVLEAGRIEEGLARL